MKEKCRPKFNVVMLFFVMCFGMALSANAEQSAVYSPQQQTTSGIVVRGKIVTEEKGEPVIGANVVVKSSRTNGTSTNTAGEFTLTVNNASEVLSVTCIGMLKREYKLTESAVKSGNLITIKMSSDVQAVGEIVVLGSVERKKDIFSGAAKVITNNALAAVSNQNAITSLGSLDPSFSIVTNSITNLSGDNPNVMPSVEIRGRTALTAANIESRFALDPNQPLFIMDGFETTMQIIIDMPLDRIASVTLLKDAASTAMYGSRAANGVVVVETVKPKVGRYRVFYNGSFNFEYPDLSSYNLMNAAENLEFERLSGRYIYNRTLTEVAEYEKQYILDQKYSTRLADVLRGVDSYWISEPVQNAFVSRNGIRIEGGSEELLVSAGASYKNQPGVMKGSQRNTWTGNIDLRYRKNKLSINNSLNLSGVDADESNYGSFSNWSRANPYYRKWNEDGSISKYMETNVNNSNVKADDYTVVNPLYNALAGGYDNSKNLVINDNLRLTWEISKGQRIEAALRILKSTETSTTFTPPENSVFDNVTLLQKGTYYNGEVNMLNYQTHLVYRLTKSIGKHYLVFDAQGELDGTSNEFNGYSAVGYPAGTSGDPSFAYTYKPDAAPDFENQINRRVGLSFLGSYSYDNRYSIDASYRTEGSNVFGSSRKYQPFWSAGLGWRMHNEAFLRDVSWINVLRLRGNIGTGGNQNINSGNTSTSIYTYVSKYNMFGTGLDVTSLGNPYLEWTKTRQISLGVEFQMWDGRFSSEFNVYEKYTDPLILPLDAVPSAGVASTVKNVGNLTVRGFEFDLSYNIIDMRAQRVQWAVRFMGTAMKSEFNGLGDRLQFMNKLFQTSKSLQRYKDGYSQEDIWAVKSLGIDPATGREMFLTKDGIPTFVYNANDIIRVGNESPDLRGTISTNLRFKQFTLYVGMSYSIGGEILNSALYTKVENISLTNIVYNQDKRALYSRWKTPGDISQFKAISMTSTTPMSSRFVQTENRLSGDAISLKYEFPKTGWIRHLSLERLYIQAYMNDIFRLSNIRMERGIDYLFSRSVSLSVAANF